MKKLSYSKLLAENRLLRKQMDFVDRVYGYEGQSEAFKIMADLAYNNKIDWKELAGAMRFVEFFDDLISKRNEWSYAKEIGIEMHPWAKSMRFMTPTTKLD